MLSPQQLTGFQRWKSAIPDPFETIRGNKRGKREKWRNEMPRIRRGAEVEKNGRWYGRVRYVLPNGKRKDIWMPAQDKTHAAQLVKDKLRELETTGETDVNSDRVTFLQLAEKYKERKLFPAKIINSRKVAGVKSLKPALQELEALKSWFGTQRIKSITHSDIETYKLNRLETPTIHKGQRAIASVNRELERLRAMFRFAIRQNWLIRSPFEMGDTLISKADETKRERVLTFDEEQRLLQACGERLVTYKARRGNRVKEITRKDDGKSRQHLRALIVAALDTGCRRGELFKLKWKDVDLDSGSIVIRAENSKTARERMVGITPRLHDELLQLQKWEGQNADALVFGLSCTIKTAWKSLCTDAGIEALRFHDLRHTAITRMVKAGQPTALIMKVSGHTQHSTFARYVNPDTQAVINIAEALAAYNHSHSKSKEKTSEMVN
jgi:integrase